MQWASVLLNEGAQRIRVICSAFLLLAPDHLVSNACGFGISFPSLEFVKHDNDSLRQLVPGGQMQTYSALNWTESLRVLSALCLNTLHQLPVHHVGALSISVLLSCYSLCFTTYWLLYVSALLISKVSLLPPDRAQQKRHVPAARWRVGHAHSSSQTQMSMHANTNTPLLFLSGLPGLSACAFSPEPRKGSWLHKHVQRRRNNVCHTVQVMYWR